MDELFGTDNFSKSRKKIFDKEKEERKRNVIVFIFLIVFASVLSYIYIMFNTSSKIENAKGILRRCYIKNKCCRIY